MTELTDEQVLERAIHAKRIWDDEVFKETIAMAEEAGVVRWRMSTTPEEREDCYFELRGLQRITLGLEKLFDDGEIVKDQLKKEKRHEQ